MLRVNPDITIETPQVFQEILTYYGLNQAQFAKRCGWKTSEALTHILGDRSKPSWNTMNTIIRTFPDLNGDRMLRGKGPLLLAELCIEESETKVHTNVSSITSDKEEYYKAVIQGKDNEIKKQDDEIKFLRGLLVK